MEFTYSPLPKGPHTKASTGRECVGGWPITSYFGPRIDPVKGGPGNHGGQDIAGAGINGTAFYAVADGYVSQGWDPGGGGNWTTLSFPNGARVGYGHASSFAPGVNGRRVAAGTVLGYVGTTGKSTGPHLHFAYDSEDAGTAYDDPYEPLRRVADAGRFVGATTPVPDNPPPLEVPGMSAEDVNKILEGQAKILNLLQPLEYVDDWHHDTRSIIIDGVRSTMRAGVTEAGWASRPYLFRIQGKDELYELVYVDGKPRRRHISGDPKYAGFTEHQFLTMVRANPHVVVLPPEAEVVLNDIVPVLA